jgi:hypothetical protein
VGHLDEARPILEDVLTRSRTATGLKRRDLPTVLSSLAWLHKLRGDKGRERDYQQQEIVARRESGTLVSAEGIKALHQMVGLVAP